MFIYKIHIGRHMYEIRLCINSFCGKQDWHGSVGNKKHCIVYRTSERGWDMHMVSHSNNHPHLQFVASNVSELLHIHLGSENEGSPRYLKSKLQCYWTKAISIMGFWGLHPTIWEAFGLRVWANDGCSLSNFGAVYWCLLDCWSCFPLSWTWNRVKS